MPKTIIQKIIFKNTTPKTVYSLYMDEKKHSQVTGSTTKIKAVEGTEFMAYDGYITGKNICLVKDKMIVQTWRAQDWKKDDPDSIFIIQISSKGKDVVVDAVHANVPKKHFRELKKGWHEHYWENWQMFLQANKPSDKGDLKKRSPLK